jgi:hypothetical protein
MLKIQDQMSEFLAKKHGSIASNCREEDGALLCLVINVKRLFHRSAGVALEVMSLQPLPRAQHAP